MQSNQHTAIKYTAIKLNTTIKLRYYNQTKLLQSKILRSTHNLYGRNLNIYTPKQTQNYSFKNNQVLLQFNFSTINVGCMFRSVLEYRQEYHYKYHKIETKIMSETCSTPVKATFEQQSISVAVG
jgi:hypothetical protein